MIEILPGPETTRDGMRVASWHADVNGFPLFVEYELRAGENDATREENALYAERAREDLKQAVASVLFLRRRAKEWGWLTVMARIVLPLMRLTDPGLAKAIKACLRDSVGGRES